MSARRYLLLVICCSALLIALYVVVVYAKLASFRFDRPDLYPPYTVAELTRHGEDKRLLLFGGSNVRYSINSTELEQALGIPILNMGSNYARAMRSLVQEIRRFSSDGDIVVLSLEWPFYSRQIENEHFFLSAFAVRSYFNDYFFHASLWERLQFILEIPTEIAIKGVFDQLPLRLDYGDYRRRVAANLESLVHEFPLRSDQGGILGRNLYGDSITHDRYGRAQAKETNCDFIFNQRYRVSDRFKQGLAELHELAEQRHLQLIFIAAPSISKDCWPALAEPIAEFQADIDKVLAGYGYAMLGSIKDHAYGLDHILDKNFFHLNALGKREHSKKVQAYLEHSDLQIKPAGQTLHGLLMPALLPYYQQRMTDIYQQWQDCGLEHDDTQAMIDSCLLFDAGWVLLADQEVAMHPARERAVLFKYQRAEDLHMRVDAIGPKQSLAFSLNDQPLDAVRQDDTHYELSIPASLLRSNAFNRLVIGEPVALTEKLTIAYRPLAIRQMQFIDEP